MLYVSVNQNNVINIQRWQYNRLYVFETRSVLIRTFPEIYAKGLNSKG